MGVDRKEPFLPNELRAARAGARRQDGVGEAIGIDRKRAFLPINFQIESKSPESGAQNAASLPPTVSSTSGRMPVPERRPERVEGPRFGRLVRLRRSSVLSDLSAPGGSAGVRAAHRPSKAR